MSISSSDNQLDLSNCTSEALTALIIRSVQYTDENTLRQLLKRGEEIKLPIVARNDDWTKWNALHEAVCRPNSLECLKLLLDYSERVAINFDDETHNGDTALIVACRFGCAESVSMLLEKGCNPLKLGRHGNSAMHNAIEANHIKIVELLLDHSSEGIDSLSWCGLMTPLFLAVLRDRLEICRMLLEKGANVLLVSAHSNQDLPLHWACAKKNIEMIRLLLEYDSTVSLNYQNAEGKTPLMIALGHVSDVQNIRLLLEKGAKTDIRAEKGKLALHFAAERDNPESLQLVLEHTDASCIEQWFSNIPNVLRIYKEIDSLTCFSILSKNAKCVEILLSSGKLSKCILQAPFVWTYGDKIEVYSPLACVFNLMINFSDEDLDSHLQVLFEHKLIVLDEFFDKLGKWSLDKEEILIQNPFSVLFSDYWIFSRPYDYYFHLLKENNVTIDYCLRCYHDNTQPFATFTQYKKYYQPVLDVIYRNNIDALKLILSESVILEPDKLIILFDAECADAWDRRSLFPLLRRKIWKYVISLKPVYYIHIPIRHGEIEPSAFPYSTIGEEFSKSTLQQLCRTVIRYHIRGYSVADNLLNFKRNIMELPLPSSLKDYLLFKA